MCSQLAVSWSAALASFSAERLQACFSWHCRAALKGALVGRNTLHLSKRVKNLLCAAIHA